jgi:1,4-alpha-glucan branching enzyme
MGWMHDTLTYVAKDPVHRVYHHDTLTLPTMYAHAEQYLLPLSHDEVVHGKGSLMQKMPGDRWQRLAGLRSLLAYQWAFPGKQLIFMGAELAQESEWSEQWGLDWSGLHDPGAGGIRSLLADLNRAYRDRPALWTRDSEPDGFRWVFSDGPGNLVAFLRYGADGSSLACVVNFAGMPHLGYSMGLPAAGTWREVVNTDAADYGGSGVGNLGAVTATDTPLHGLPASAQVTVGPYAAVWLAPVGSD